MSQNLPEHLSEKQFSGWKSRNQKGPDTKIAGTIEMASLVPRLEMEIHHFTELIKEQKNHITAPLLRVFVTKLAVTREPAIFRKVNRKSNGQEMKIARKKSLQVLRQTRLRG